MKLKFVIILFLLISKFGAFAQEYTATGESLNKAMKLTEQAVGLLSEQNFKASFPLLLKAIETEPTLREAYLRLFTVAMNDSIQIDTIIPILQKSKKIFQEDDEICYYLGEIYKLKGKMKRAMYEFSMAIIYSKKNGEDFYLVHKYYFNRANICLAKNRISTAVLDYTYALSLKPNYGSAYANRGICLYKMGEIEAACKDWKQAVELGISQSEEYIKKNCKLEAAK